MIIDAIFEARPVVLEKFMKAGAVMKPYWKARLDQLNTWDGDWDWNRFSPAKELEIIQASQEWAR